MCNIILPRSSRDAFACVNARGGLVGVGSFFLFFISKLSDMGLAQTTQTSTEGMVWSYDINVCTRMLMLNAKKSTQILLISCFYKRSMQINTCLFAS